MRDSMAALFNKKLVPPKIRELIAGYNLGRSR
jgi:hypothetical protein